MVRVGIIGTGRIGKVHIRALNSMLDHARIVAVADPYLDEKAVRDLVVSPEPVKFTKNVDEVFTDPDVDAVFICTPTDTHVEYSLKAIAAGKHVFCEKPVDRTLEEIRKVMAALEGKNLKYMVGFNRRYDHNFAAARKATKDGKIGKVECVRVTSRDPGLPSMDYLKGSGGMFLDMTIHDFDMVRFQAGSDIDEIFVESACLVDPAVGEIGDIDSAAIVLKMKNGALAVIENSRRACYGYDQRCEVFGSDGLITVSNDAPNNAMISGADGVHAEKPYYFFLERYEQAYHDEVAEFIKAVENDTEVPAGIYDGLMGVAAAVAANLSMKEHRPVKMSEII